MNIDLESLLKEYRLTGTAGAEVLGEHIQLFRDADKPEEIRVIRADKIDPSYGAETVTYFIYEPK